MENNLTPHQEALSMLRDMTVDFSIDLWQSKQCAIKCCERILSLPLPPDRIEHYQKVLAELESI